jgi:transcription-repair coupling factor (superfamily II helicase)
MSTAETIGANQAIRFTGVVEGHDALVLAGLLGDAQAAGGGAGETILHVARDDRRLDQLERGLAFFAPKVRVVTVPAWDTVPYDRIGPNAEIVAKRMASLARLALGAGKEPMIVLTTVNSVLQRLPPRAFVRQSMRQLAPGQRIDLKRLSERLVNGGYQRTGTVMEPGEFAVRGGILDVFPPARQAPVRLDFFGDTLESIKSFDPETQRTQKTIQKLILMPVSECALGEDATRRFRQRYVELFGGATGDDPLYQAVSEGQRFPGMEHWLPFFHEELETLFDYAGDARVTLDELSVDALDNRFEQIREHYDARLEGLEAQTFGAPPYKPVPPDRMFIDCSEWLAWLGRREHAVFTEFRENEDSGAIDKGARRSRNFAPERLAEGEDLFGAVVGHIKSRLNARKRVIVAAWTAGARERFGRLIAERGLEKLRQVANYREALALPGDQVALAVLGLEHGFETDDLLVVGEQDVLGDRLVRPRRRRKKAVDVITEAAALSVGDLVVHADHGIGRFESLTTVEALGARHDCLELVYAGGDKLFLPVENIELLSRYGQGGDGAQLDRLGGAAWQSRKARLKQRLREIASELIQVAAQRMVRSAPEMTPPEGAYDEFVARFPFEETEDQLASIEAVLEDLGAGRPMDRLVCGDVGFGKTEVALRAAFVAALAGYQVAVVVPTTLLARQHYRAFVERFRGFPVRVAQASRLVPPKELSQVKKALKEGQVDIVIGTHALLGKSVEFAHLGLVIVDEEQHFGVAHKERLKQMRSSVHVLTLSATPIPRTLQLALSGVRELSLITTPPVDRLAVRSYITPFDPVILREALRRERYRGGQTFYVVPRISDLEEVAEFLEEAVPDLRVAQAHGQLPPAEIERIMSAFYDGEFDILLSTAIVESGLDVPNANTMIVHRADQFGLAQLYQLRGRVGRSKTRAYAYFTTSPGKRLTEGAERRLKVLNSLDTLGAGFALASHDLDIRGGGNLLGEEQSGHIREVGFELYQSMLEEAITSLKSDGNGEAGEQWSPQISIGLTSLIPDGYVSDLQVRLGLYRRLSNLTTREDIDQFGAELEDRFGALPPEVETLLGIIEIKGFCVMAGIAQIDAGPKGGVIQFRDNKFPNPEGLVAFMQKSRGGARLQADHKLVYKADWAREEDRIKGVLKVVRALADIERAAAPATA